ncbi:MAG TPA: FAD-dependent oxidoreductase [Verrucomicrobiae bacterium]|jgi:sulfide:quinone oxidoreductase|nr:FAD-dependent oxidoreductase [Verrucomicrobiae bacterium]
MKKRILVLGAGFGGLELSTMLSEAFGDGMEVTLIDKNDSFYFGFSKLDVMFGLATPDSVRLPYKKFVKPGVRLLQETISSIDPVAKRVTTDRGVHEADFLVVALGADFDFAATLGLAGATEFYTLEGATRLGKILPTFTEGRVLIAVGGAPFKCPPAPSEAALMMHDYLTKRGIRDACKITLVLPLEVPVPPSPETSRALLCAFAERNIAFVADREMRSVDTKHRVVTLDDGRELPYDLFLGVPAIRAPKILEKSGMTENGYVPVKPKTLETRFPDVYAIGDCARQGTPKAGVFAEGAGRAVAKALIARLRNENVPVTHAGIGSCYIEFGGGRIGRVDVDFFSNPDHPVGTYHEPSVALRADKEHFGASRRARWFGL